MGRVYITLGEPQQRQKLLGLQKITPMEIWFYQNANPALPPFFYVVFFQRDATSEFKLYSPYGDGPEKLITAIVAPSRAQALKTLSDDAGRDVARVSLSLLTDEPVDMNDGTVSLQSDVMLGTIRNLANNPISKRELASHRQAIEDVSHRIVLDKEFLDVVAVPLRDSSGNPNLHYVLRLKRADDFSVGRTANNGAYYYAILASTKVSTSDGKLVLREEKKISREVSETELERVKSRVFGYEGWLPLPPGKYKIEFQLTNLVGNTSFRREIETVIPEVTESLGISSLVPFAEASMIPVNSARVQPFTGGGVRFIPMAGDELQLIQGQELKLFYQVWDPGALGQSRTGQKLSVDYAFGRMGAHDIQTIHDEIPLEQLDSGGSIINGKRIPTVDLATGNYRVVVTITDPRTQQKAFGSLSFGVYPETSALPAWDVSDDGAGDRERKGTADFQRGQCYQALGNAAEALKWFQQAYAKNSGDEHFRSTLTDLYFGRQDYGKVVDLYSANGITASTDEKSILRVAESLEKTGNLNRAVAVLESGTALNPSSGPLLLGLAEYYRKAGQPDKAAAAEKKGKQFLVVHPQS